MELRIKLAGTSDAKIQGYVKCALKTKATRAMLKREPNNPVDKNAIKVIANIGPGRWIPIGYLPAPLAKSLAGYGDNLPWVTSCEIRYAGTRMPSGVVIRMTDRSGFKGQLKLARPSVPAYALA